MANNLFTTVVLDMPRRIRFRPGVAYYRFGGIKGKRFESLPEALSNSRTFHRALCQWLYLCMDDESAEVDSPEAVADLLIGKSKDELTEIARTLLDCVSMYKEPESKNAAGSTPLPSPTSS